MKIYYRYYRVPDNHLYRAIIRNLIRLGKGKKLPTPTYLCFLYYRKINSFFRLEQKPFPRGGITICEIHDGDTVIMGKANCSLRDNFNYQSGRIRAFTRAHREYQRINGNKS